MSIPSLSKRFFIRRLNSRPTVHCLIGRVLIRALMMTPESANWSTPQCLEWFQNLRVEFGLGTQVVNDSPAHIGDLVRVFTIRDRDVNQVERVKLDHVGDRIHSTEGNGVNVAGPVSRRRMDRMERPSTRPQIPAT